MLLRPKWMLFKLLVQGRFVLKNAKFYFLGRTVLLGKWGHFVKIFVPGSLCPKDRFIPGTFHTQNFWDEKP
jgi:hypothetical protein